MQCQECKEIVTEKDCTFGGLHKPCFCGRVFLDDGTEYLGILGRGKKKEVDCEGDAGCAWC